MPMTKFYADGRCCRHCGQLYVRPRRHCQCGGGQWRLCRVEVDAQTGEVLREYVPPREPPAQVGLFEDAPLPQS